MPIFFAQCFVLRGLLSCCQNCQSVLLLCFLPAVSHTYTIDALLLFCGYSFIDFFNGGKADEIYSVAISKYILAFEVRMGTIYISISRSNL
jgi:hypothetical protein